MAPAPRTTGLLGCPRFRRPEELLQVADDAGRLQDESVQKGVHEEAARIAADFEALRAEHRALDAEHEPVNEERER